MGGSIEVLCDHGRDLSVLIDGDMTADGMPATLSLRRDPAGWRIVTVP